MNVVLIEVVTPGEVWAAGVVLPAVALVVVVARFTLRTRNKLALGADDWLIAFALLTLIGMGVLLSYGVAKHLFGYPSPSIPGASEQEQFTEKNPVEVQIFKLEYAFQLLTTICYGVTKASILFFYRRLFVIQRRSFLSIFTWGLLTLVALWTLGFLLAFIFPCGTRFSDNWGSAAEVIRYCSSSTKSVKGLVVSDLILDVAIIAIPIPFVWRLNMSVARRILVSGILLVGFTAVAVSIARLAIYFILFTEGAKIDRNVGVGTTIGLYWFMLEGGIAVIAACLPSLSSLLDMKVVGVYLNSLHSLLSPQSWRSGRTAARSKSTVNEGKEKRMAMKKNSSLHELVGLPCTETSSQDLAAGNEPPSWTVFSQKTVQQKVSAV